MKNLDYRTKQIIVAALFATAILSSLITYLVTKNSYQEKYYSQLLEEKAQQETQRDKLNQKFKFNIGNEKAY